MTNPSHLFLHYFTDKYLVNPHQCTNSNDPAPYTDFNNTFLFTNNYQNHEQNTRHQGVREGEIMHYRLLSTLRTIESEYDDPQFEYGFVVVYSIRVV
jgi:hypothetical protein